MAYIGAGISRFNTADELTVTGTSEFGGNVSFGDNNITNVGSLQIDSIAGDADTNTNITFAGSDVITMTTAGSERMRIDASGNVGIGGLPVLSSSAYNGASLHLRQPGSSTTGGQLRFTTGASGHTASDGAFISYFSDNNLYYNNQESGDHKFFNGGSERLRIESDGNLRVNDSIDNLTGTLTLNGRNTGNILFQSGGNEKMRLASDGNVGIGTSSPSVGSSGYGVHIKGPSGKDGLIKLDSSDSTHSGWLQFTENGTDQWRIAYDPTNNHLEFTESGVADRMVIADGGKVGIGVTPDSELHIDRGQVNIRFGYNNLSENYIDADTQIFRSGGGSEHMRITSGGNVGIGTTSPATQLEIDGGASSATYRMTNDATAAAGGNGLNLSIDNSLNASLTNAKAGALTFGTSNAERMSIDSSGNVGIGQSSPNQKLDVNGNIVADAYSLGAGAGIFLRRGFESTAQPSITVQDHSGSAPDGLSVNGNDGVSFRTSDTERMRILSGGDLHLGGTSQSDGKLTITGKSSGGAWATKYITDVHSGTYYFINFCKNESGVPQVGSITSNGTSTSYNTSSDHRLKENVADMTGAIDRVKALAPKRFNFIADADTTVDGFLAHEAQTVVPEAVTGTHNEVDDDGNAVMQGIDQSKLVPLLTGALQEAIAKIETLEARVAALEAN